MGFDIPEPFCWDESFCVFYEKLDEEHKGLFQGVFKVAANRTDGAALAHLLKLTKDHFVDEEAMMKAKSYAGLADHQRIHSEFVAKLTALSCPIDDATVHFAKEWLVNHIKGIDFKYKGLL
jgi:hemerythrin family non-heme iron protein